MNTRRKLNLQSGNMTETIELDNNFHIDVDVYESFADCEVHFCNGYGYGACEDYVRVDVDKAKQIIAALTKFVEAKEGK